jgi:hypothetical protein
MKVISLGASNHNQNDRMSMIITLIQPMLNLDG